VSRDDANRFLESLSAEQLEHLDKLMGFDAGPDCPLRAARDAEREADRAALRRAGITVPQ
jgi:hypothetical protein